eukprot:11026113-Lingulodinium_polyedra.AAC.1
MLHTYAVESTARCRAGSQTAHRARAPCERRKWCLHGVRQACGLRAVAAADSRFVLSLIHI